MKTTYNSVHIENPGDKTINITAETFNAMKQEKAVEKSKNNEAQDVSEDASEWYNGSLVNRWDD